MVRTGVHLSFMAGETRNLRLRVTRRDEPELEKLIEWVLGIADTRYRAWIAGEPDPYGLPLPDSLAKSSSGLRFVRGTRENRDQAVPLQGGPP